MCFHNIYKKFTKFVNSEKAKNICILLGKNVKSSGRLHHIFMAFSEYMNFTAVSISMTPLLEHSVAQPMEYIFLMYIKYRNVASSRPDYYSILDPFGHKHQIFPSKAV